MNLESFQKESEKNLDIPKEFSAQAFLAYTRNKYYVEAWAEKISGGSSKLRFNFWAAVYGPVWCMYVKLYALGFILSLVELGLLCGGSYFNDHSDIGDMKAIYFTILVIVFFRICFGFLANITYFKKAKKDISALIQSRIPQIYFGDSVKSSGGVNFGAALGYGFAWSILGRFAIEFFKNL